ncbi:hypothetical protein C8Q74DRAFT_1294365 [Fomes fomentarius]|nr:hypothetical protein C8Q74DRAFT_1294365 [Fomes fomentarius]
MQSIAMHLQTDERFPDDGQIFEVQKSTTGGPGRCAWLHEDATYPGERSLLRDGFVHIRKRDR